MVYRRRAKQPETKAIKGKKETSLLRGIVFGLIGSVVGFVIYAILEYITVPEQELIPAIFIFIYAAISSFVAGWITGYGYTSGKKIGDMTTLTWLGIIFGSLYILVAVIFYYLTLTIGPTNLIYYIIAIIIAAGAGIAGTHRFLKKE